MNLKSNLSKTDMSNAVLSGTVDILHIDAIFIVRLSPMFALIYPCTTTSSRHKPY